MTDRITAHIDGHGDYASTPELFARAIDEYLPASPAELQKIVQERTGQVFAPLSISLSLAMLASFYHENPF